MVGTIGLTGSKGRETRGVGRWWFGIGGLHVLSAAAAGGVLGLTIGLFGAVASRVASPLPLFVLAIAMGVLAIAESIGLPAAGFARRKQVPMSWREVFPARMSAAAYGAVLGFGILSTVYSWTFWALVVSIAALSNIALGFAAGIAYGLGRVLPVIAAAYLSEEWTLTLIGGVDRWKRYVRQVSAAAIALLGWIFVTQGSVS